MFILLRHAMLEDFPGALSSCESPFLPHPYGVLFDLNQVAGKVTEEHLTHCHVDETFCFVHYHVRRSH